MKRTGWLLLFYTIASIALFLYSLTQIDANMTISRFGLLQVAQQMFQRVGMNERPLSTLLYAGILVVLFALYIWVLSLIKKGTLDEHGFWRIVAVTSVILLPSYPAFSYDMFNYMFTAKTVLVYRQNPYEVLPMEFSGIDPWLLFMRWVHLPSAYTPIWIFLTLPAYLVSFGFLLPLLWSIKLVVLLFHLVTIIGIGRILARVEPQKKTLGMALFALNPLIIIENLVSSHNDVVMMAFAVWAIVLYLEKKKLASWFALSLSIATKLITAIIIPVWFFIDRKGIDWRKWMLIFMVGGLLAVIATREVLPWYWVWIMPFIALLPSMNELTVLSTGVSLGLLLRYAPYLYLGNWDPPALLWKNIGTWLPIVVSVLTVLWSKRATLRR